MKPLTVALLFSFAATGAACSDTVKSNADAAPKAAAEGDPLSVDTSTITSETELSGTLNLNIGAPQESSSRLLGSGGLGGSGQGGIVLGSGGVGGGNFGQSFDLGIDLDEIEDPAAALDAPVLRPAEDDIVRLPN
ncbi:MAG: hypothetical protein CVT79_03220 [Alphaproteobacteria bacterium HGW-Alphaproteobacteria-18]|nr:MAG: hypothetical protein CVT79_03220 [Alphaproteobacteria bacterium HGW-Alphaproteobacteria-18]